MDDCGARQIGRNQETAVKIKYYIIARAKLLLGIYNRLEKHNCWSYRRFRFATSLSYPVLSGEELLKITLLLRSLSLTASFYDPNIVLQKMLQFWQDFCRQAVVLQDVPFSELITSAGEWTVVFRILFFWVVIQTHAPKKLMISILTYTLRFSG
ncbi:hypothetical protein AVEN_262169-1 [Araneus ventricosus]|uniref:Uncharacterized protein n=1 Tax=Araneus ventricosus TaxID=182803 RepID=A0A4Y2EKL1_ARAVE|nr:hypothetical protein AVEN_262169-1 [Araneus ventricosus]